MRRHDTGVVVTLPYEKLNYQVEGLAPDTEYTFSVWAENAGVRGEVATITGRTRRDTAPRLLSVVQLSPRSVRTGDRVTFRIEGTELIRAEVALRNSEGLWAQCFSWVETNLGHTYADCTILTEKLEPGRWQLNYLTIGDTTSRTSMYHASGLMGYQNCFGPLRHKVDLSGMYFDLTN